MISDTVALQRNGSIAVVRLNRPEAGNTFNPELLLAFREVVKQVAGDPAVRCVVLTGAGKLFCGGGDIMAMAAAEDRPAMMHELAGVLHDAVASLASMAKPLVVLVNGPAAGAGMSLAIAGDVVLAARSASFLAAYGSVGLTPDGGMSWFLPRLVGLRRAQDLIIAGRRLTAEEAADIGLVTRVVDDEVLLREGMVEAERLASGPVGALGAARALLAQGFDNDLVTHLALEAQTIAVAGGSAEAQEGMRAFMEQRAPVFSKIPPG